MMQRHYRFAGLEVTVSMPEEMMYENEYRLAPFGVDAVTDPHVFRFERVESLTPPNGTSLVQRPDFWAYQELGQSVRYIGTTARSWEGAHSRVAHRGKVHVVQLCSSTYPGRVSSKTVLEVMAAEHLVVQNHGVIFHCSYIDHEGQAILFTAPSETGKSTQADLWHKYRGTDIINGDRAAVRIVDGKIMAEGIPFSGSSSYCENRSLPLKAIVYLAQAPRTTIRKLRGYGAFSRIWEGISVNTWDKGDLELASAAVQRIAESVPVYYMPCTPDEAAVAVLEETLRKQAIL